MHKIQSFYKLYQKYFSNSAQKMINNSFNKLSAVRKILVHLYVFHCL